MARGLEGVARMSSTARVGWLALAGLLALVPCAGAEATEPAARVLRTVHPHGPAQL